MFSEFSVHFSIVILFKEPFASIVSPPKVFWGNLYSVFYVKFHSFFERAKCQMSWEPLLTDAYFTAANGVRGDGGGILNYTDG